jgi:predicted alpha/beta-fold hydrolase
VPPACRWRGELQDPATGRVEVTGQLSRAGAAAGLVILVHGLGGSAESSYLRRAARVAHGLGLDTLRLNLRGADPAARDFYHGGLTAELHAAVAAPAFAGHEWIGVLGYSMGGHVALRYAAEVADPRVIAVAAICAPLHLRTVSQEFDRPSRWLYRYWVLRHLRRCFAELERAGAPLPSRFAAIRQARTFRRWDSLTVVPRFGFADADDYYERASAAAALHRLRVPCLLVASEIDPVITPRAIEPYLPSHAAVGGLPGGLPQASCRPAGAGRPADFTLLWHAGAGHVAFPAACRLEANLLTWLDDAAGFRRRGR